MENEKRTEAITLHLTQGERDTLEALAELLERKPAELARLILTKGIGKKWAEQQEKEHPENCADFTRPKFGELIGNI